MSIGCDRIDELEKGHYYVETFEYDVLTQFNSNTKVIEVYADCENEAKSKAIKLYTEKNNSEEVECRECELPKSVCEWTVLVGVIMSGSQLKPKHFGLPYKIKVKGK